jgi:putative NADH-flavin reductase
MASPSIIGASRGIGLETVKGALRAGHSVRALARSATSIPIQDARLEKVSGDALDSDTIRDALRDVNVVIQTLGVDPWGNRIEIVSYDNVQFTKAPNVLRGMGLIHLSKNEQAIKELTAKDMAPN